MILIVDDEIENRVSLKAVLERSGWPCFEAADAQSALEILRSHPKIQLLITDLKMPGMNGLELLQMARLVRPDVQRVLVTAFGTIEDTVQAMKAGAFDVIAKPLKAREIREKVATLLARSPTSSSLVSQNEQQSKISPSFALVMEKLRKAAQSEANVLFVGESGTGKSFLAHQLHLYSARNSGPFVALNCASIPNELLESELFGYEKGAFTGATQNRDGKIAAANNGTLLLDEIADLGSNLQAKLLQFIQERKFYRLGSNREISANVRIVSATNRKLEDLVKNNLFREDLLYRLKVVEIEIPPLRDRKSDLLWLLPALMDSLCEKNKLPPVRLTQEALSKLYHYNWPGNVRELENVLESSLVLARPENIQEGFLKESDLPENFHTVGTLKDFIFQDLASIEKSTVEHALAMTGGNRRLTAGLLGISERTLYRIIGQQRHDEQNP